MSSIIYNQWTIKLYLCLFSLNLRNAINVSNVQKLRLSILIDVTSEIIASG